MSSADSFTPIEAYLRAQWTSTELVFENEVWPVPDNPESFLFVELLGGIYAQASLGAEPVTANLWRESGEVRGHVLVKSGTGTLLARQYAQAFANLFRGVELGSITFYDASIGAGEPGDDDGNYFRMTVSIDFERDQTS
jgi:hypothetical protein